MADHQIDITIITNANGSFTTEISPIGPVRPGKRIQWQITAPNFQQDTEIYLQFYKKNSSDKKEYVAGCMHGGPFNNPNKPGKGGAGKNGRLISAKVRNLAQGKYHYEIRYSDDGGCDYLIKDPEIIVEGTPEPAPGVKGGNRRRAARRKLIAKRAQLTIRAKQTRRAKAKKAAKRARR